MTKWSGLFDGAGVDYDPPEWNAIYARFLGNGYIPAYLNELLVYKNANLAPMIVSVKSGGCNINGYHLFSDADEELTISTAPVSGTRIDLIVARLTTTGSPGSIDLVIHQGTTGAGAPSPTWASPTYELVLAYITVAAGTTAITTAMISDKRSDDTLCGPARPAAVGKTAYANVAMSGYRLTGCGNPASAQDMDTMAARDAALLAKIPSQAGNTGKFLTTNGSVTSWAAQGAFFQATASNTLVKSSDTAITIVSSSYALMKSISTPIVHLPNGVYRVKFSLYVYGNVNEHAYGKIYVNGIAAGTERHLQGDGGSGTTVEYSEDITITAAGGAAIQLYAYHTGGQLSQVLNFRIYCTEAIPW